MVNYYFEIDKPVKPSVVYLHLFHGRDNPEQNMENWGDDGPIIGPLKYVHETYFSDLKVEFINYEDATKFGFEQPGVEQHFRLKEDMIEHNGKFYGDWSVFGESLAKEHMNGK